MYNNAALRHSPNTSPTHHPRQLNASYHRDEPKPPTANTYYDPTSEGRERKSTRQFSGSNHHSPIQQPLNPTYIHSHHHHQPPLLDQDHIDRNGNIRPTIPDANITSPNASNRSIMNGYPHTPRADKSAAHHTMAIPVAPLLDKAPSPSPRRVADPMSFSSILSKPDPEPIQLRPQPVSPIAARPPTQPVNHEMNTQSMEKSRPVELLPDQRLNVREHDDANLNDSSSHTILLNNFYPETLNNSPKQPRNLISTNNVKPETIDKPETHNTPLPHKPRPTISEKDLQAAHAKLNAEDLSDIDAPRFDVLRLTYQDRALKRFRDIVELEATQRKRRRIANTQRLAAAFSQHANLAKDEFYEKHEKAAYDEVHAKDVAEDKEKKKIAQRNRRRELQKQKHEREAADFQQRAQDAEDDAEKEKFIKEAQKAEKKVTNTTRLLNGEVPNRDLREATPLAPNMDGGMIGSFPMSEDRENEPLKKKAKTSGIRLKKSKEQKRAEKESAAAGYAAMERGEELVSIAPKGVQTTRAMKRDLSTARDHTPAERTPASIKVYDQLYEQIWRDIARKDVPKLCRIKDNSLATKQANLRKTAQLASKEARRWQLKTNKSQKDTQARAKRIMREMLSFWKRNEREERDQRKMAEKQELESARKAEADREANRAKRKLNFLISQTELYSHFIGKKVKTDEVERSTDDVAAAGEKTEPAVSNARTIDLPDSEGQPAAKVTNFEDLDFDADDDSTLRAAAMANAQNAVQEAQDRARAFNNEGQTQSAFDDGEMNFQNPTSLQSMDVEQPKMLTCQLKEYQLKGLNWLVNLYEQGINGILADEMGLGKTVQSISVMSYLAEAHNIWGPFLVIAPASTLHNWQQEIVRFVPTLKVLPYWGNAKDRKVLRKFWDRKHITYTKDSPFHVLVTSYQLVVQDTQYFQKIRWQYMILDEAQAIKSSQSSRWKSLLGFHCRNRLLLTGTPIQNNMQELWALLHFIMPSLFDSHDEFSDWFSKDIESHAQSNTKLNEDQLKRLHMILKPFMLRRIKRHVQKELGDKIEEDVFCDLTYRQRAYYSNLRNKISIMDLIEKAAIGDDNDTATLMNLVMQFRKVCNHPDLFERADTKSPAAFSYFAETASFLREGHSIDVAYSVRSLIELRLPRLIARDGGRLDIAGPDNLFAGWRTKMLFNECNIWHQTNMKSYAWLPFINQSACEVSTTAFRNVFERAVELLSKNPAPAVRPILDNEEPVSTPRNRLLMIVDNKGASSLSTQFQDSVMHGLLNISQNVFDNKGIAQIEPAARPAATAPPIELFCSSQGVINERKRTFFNIPMRRALFGISEKTEALLLDSKIRPEQFPIKDMLPQPNSTKARWTNIHCPSMRRFVTDSGKLAKLDELLGKLKEGGHRVLLYFQMTRMIDLMEEYLTYRNYKFCRLDGSTKLEDRRDTVADFQSIPDIFVFLLSTRAGGLGINLTAADTVIFYDSDWNPTIDSQAMDRAHRLGQTRQVTVYRMITRGTIEERIRRRALQKEEVQRVVISGGAGAQVDFNTRSKENRTKDIAMWLADDDQAAEIEKKEAEIKEREEKGGLATKGKKKATTSTKKVKELSLDDMYHEGEGHFDDHSGKPSGAATPIETPGQGAGAKKKGISKKGKSAREKLAIIDGTA